MSADAAVEPLATVSDGDVTVAVSRVRTRNGTRIRFEAAEASIALDAIALEALTWQADTAAATPAEGAVRKQVQVSNEYTAVDVIVPEDEAWLGLTSRRLGYERRLGLMDLAAITRLEMADISRFLTTPFGPNA